MDQLPEGQAFVMEVVYDEAIYSDSRGALRFPFYAAKLSQEESEVEINIRYRHTDNSVVLSILISQQEWPIYQNGITAEQADQVFEDDLTPFVNTVNRVINVPLEPHQLDAAVLLAYNIGVGGFSSSSAVKLINDPQAETPYSSLEDAWKAWNKSQGQVNQGLINRRSAEWEMFSKGVYERW